MRKPRCYKCERHPLRYCILHEMADVQAPRVWPKAEPWLYFYFVTSFPLIER